jgi:predicted dehydrogenase
MDRMSNRKIRVGVMGVGALGQHHARIYAQLPETELVGIYDVDAGRAAQLAAQHGCRVFASLDELASSVEAASVVVPTDLHHAVALDLLERGLHLLVEKPIAATMRRGGVDMVARAKAQGRHFAGGPRRTVQSRCWVFWSNTPRPRVSSRPIVWLRIPRPAKACIRAALR